jgi:hypothetical protein
VLVPSRLTKPGAQAAHAAHFAIAAVVATITLGLCLPAVGNAAVTIGSGSVGRQGTWEFGGNPYDATVGQVITAPAGPTHLASFVLSVQTPPAFLFRAYVYAWSEAEERATGAALYESGDLHTVEGGPAMQPIEVNTGAVPVTPGDQYVLFFSRSKNEAADSSDTSDYGIEMIETEGMEEIAPPPYAEGGAVILGNGYSPAAWTSTSWNNYESEFDMVFEATFEEPASKPGPTNTPETKVTVADTVPPPTGPRCLVPYIHNLTLTQAKAALLTAGCSLGRIQHHYNTVAKGGLVEQDRHQGTILTLGAPVDIWISLGRHKRHHRR